MCLHQMTKATLGDATFWDAIFSTAFVAIADTYTAMRSPDSKRMRNESQKDASPKVVPSRVLRRLCKINQ